MTGVAGIPSSGVPASWLVARSLGRPHVDLETWLADATRADDGSILLVDDCVTTGATMAATVARIRAQRPTTRIVTAAVYADDGAAAHVDIVLERCPAPRAFEWSLFQGPLVERSCYDFDGVLCPDPAPADDDDGERYLRFITTTPPLMLPKGRIRRIVTARLEKYRAPTEEWLARHGIRFDELVMIDLPDAAERHRRGGLGLFKAEIYAADAAAELFIESNSEQARTIARRSGKPTFDYTGRTMLGAAGVDAGAGEHRRDGRDPLRRLRHGVGWRARRVLKRWRHGSASTAAPPASWGPRAG